MGSRVKAGLSCLVLLLLDVAACAGPDAPHDPSSHNHDRGRMMIASNGAVEALLTSHLSSKTGNELDIFVEKGGAPLALTTTKIAASARRTRSGERRGLVFD